jgi:hypothetical protein
MVRFLKMRAGPCWLTLASADRISGEAVSAVYAIFGQTRADIRPQRNESRREHPDDRPACQATSCSGTAPQDTPASTSCSAANLCHKRKFRSPCL